MKIPLYSNDGTQNGDIEISDKIFGIKRINTGLIHRLLVLQQHNARHPIAHTKTRGEVRGGGKKPFRQKGTGRARQGSSRSPLNIGGGVTFGPRSNRTFEISLPKKERRLALFNLLSQKVLEKNVIALEDYNEEEIKTKKFNELIKKLPINRNALIAMPGKNKVVSLSAKNITNVKTILVNYLNPQDLLKYDTLILLKDAPQKIEETFLTHTSHKENENTVEKQEESKQ